MVSWETWRSGSLGNTRLRVPAISWGDHFHSNRVSTTRQETPSMSSLRAGRAARRRPWQLTCAVCEAYRSSGSVLRLNSRLMVDVERPSMRAMARMLEPCCLMLAIVIRSSGWSCWYFVCSCMCTPYAMRCCTSHLRPPGHSPRRAPRPLQDAPKDQWIQIPVPALVNECTFELAQERLQDNKKFSPRRTVEPSILQGLVHCARCGYALYRTSTRSSARKIYYYRCLGSDAWRYQGQARCTARPIRQDLLEDIVWREIARLLEDPTLIEAELTRRLEAAQTAHPAKRHQDRIASELVQLQRRAERLLTAYQEELLDLDELRRRMPALRQRENRLKAELESLRDQLADQSACLRLAHTLNEFLERLQTQAQNLDVLARQRIVRLIVKEIVVDNDSIAIRHSIPNSPRNSGGPTHDTGPQTTAPGSGATTSSLLCTWRDG